MIVHPFQAVDVQIAHAGGQLSALQAVDGLVIGQAVGQTGEGVGIAVGQQPGVELPLLHLVRDEIGDVGQQFSGLHAPLRVVHAQKAIELVLAEDGHLGHRLDALGGQTRILLLAARNIFHGLNAVDGHQLALPFLQHLQPFPHGLQGHGLEILDLRRDPGGAHLIGVGGRPLIPVDAEHIGPGRLILLADDLQHLVHGGIKVVRQHQLVNALHQLLLCGQAQLRLKDVGIAGHIHRQLHAAGAAIHRDDAVVEQQMTYARQFPVPGIAVVRVLPQALVGTEGTGGIHALQIFIAFYPGCHRAILLLPAAIDKYDFVGI